MPLLLVVRARARVIRIARRHLAGLFLLGLCHSIFSASLFRVVPLNLLCFSFSGTRSVCDVTSQLSSTGACLVLINQTRCIVWATGTCRCTVVGAGGCQWSGYASGAESSKEAYTGPYPGRTGPGEPIEPIGGNPRMERTAAAEAKLRRRAARVEPGRAVVPRSKAARGRVPGTNSAHSHGDSVVVGELEPGEVTSATLSSRRALEKWSSPR